MRPGGAKKKEAKPPKIKKEKVLKKPKEKKQKPAPKAKPPLKEKAEPKAKKAASGTSEKGPDKKRYCAGLMKGEMGTMKGLANLKNEGLEDKEIMKKTKHYLKQLGGFIDSVIQQKKNRRHDFKTAELELSLWGQVQKTGQSPLPVEKLRDIYKKISGKEPGPAPELPHMPKPTPKPKAAKGAAPRSMTDPGPPERSLAEKRAQDEAFAARLKTELGALPTKKKMVKEVKSVPTAGVKNEEGAQVPASSVHGSLQSVRSPAPALPRQQASPPKPKQTTPEGSATVTAAKASVVKQEAIPTPAGWPKSEQVPTPMGWPKSEKVPTPAGWPKSEVDKAPDIPKKDSFSIPKRDTGGIPKIPKKEISIPKKRPSDQPGSDTKRPKL